MKLMERLNKAKKNKKGFTLVELIVVIVILGILAAVLVPSFVKYMNDAKEAQVKVEARSAYIAAEYLYAKSGYKGTTTEEISSDKVLSHAGIDSNGVTLVIALDPDGGDNHSVSITYTKDGFTVKIPEAKKAPTT